MSLGGSSPYTSTDKTNKNKYTYTKQYKNTVQTIQKTVNTSTHITKTHTHFTKPKHTHTHTHTHITNQVTTTTVQDTHQIK